MTKEFIEQYNKKCAEFLGYVYYPDWNLFRLGRGTLNLPIKQYKPENLKFHKDWNWIHEVIEAIENIPMDFGYIVEILPANCRIYNSRNNFTIVSSDLHSTKKEAVVKAIDKFLDWYNK